MMDMSDSQLVIIGIKCVQKKSQLKLQNVAPMSLSKDQTEAKSKRSLVFTEGTKLHTFQIGRKNVHPEYVQSRHIFFYLRRVLIHKN